MKIKNPFFKKKNKVFLNDILKVLKIKSSKNNIQIYDIKDLSNATSKDITFLNSSSYSSLLTNKKYETLVGSYYEPIIVENVLFSVGLITKLFYPDSLNDTIDLSVKKPVKQNFKNVYFGLNVLLGNNVKIGKNTKVGHNTIIESNVKIGNNCVIGNNVLLKNSFIGNNVFILDGAVIGKKGFGFFPNEIENTRYPHIGMVIIEDNVEIGCNNTIDRGSISNTVIGKNTFIDNQVHIAHNVKIGKNCIITAQVGFAGSSTIGKNVQIGGQAGISGHLKIGNYVRIGGGSGVVKDVPDNSKVMGYPAKDIRKFLKDNR